MPGLFLSPSRRLFTAGGYQPGIFTFLRWPGLHAKHRVGLEQNSKAPLCECLKHTTGIESIVPEPRTQNLEPRSCQDRPDLHGKKLPFPPLALPSALVTPSPVSYLNKLGLWEMTRKTRSYTSYDDQPSLWRGKGIKPTMGWISKGNS